MLSFSCCQGLGKTKLIILMLSYCQWTSYKDWIILMMSYCRGVILMLSWTRWNRLNHPHAVILSCCHLHAVTDQVKLTLSISWCHTVMLWWTSWDRLNHPYDDILSSSFHQGPGKTGWIILMLSYCCVSWTMLTGPNNHHAVILSGCHGSCKTYWIILMLSYIYAVMDQVKKTESSSCCHIVMLSSWCYHGLDETDWIILML